MPIDLRTPGSQSTGTPVAIPGTSTMTSVALIKLGGNKRGGLLTLTVGAAALTGLKLSRAATAGGTHVDWLSGTDFNTAGNELLDAIPASGISTLGIAGVGQIKLEKLDGVQELQVWAQASSATTLQVDASFH